jgi:predicted lipoprotein with Yx(FWY)xxD motif
MTDPARARGWFLPALVAAVAGLGAAALVGVAVARSFTLRVAKHATVVTPAGSAHEDIVVNSRGRAVYELSGDTRHHPKCTKANGCWSFWVPVKVASARKLSKAHGIKGRTQAWQRGGFRQVTLAGHPLYTYTGDHQRDVATGEGIRTFGGTWHVMKAGPAKAPATSTTPAPTTTGTTTTPTTTTTPCLYPPCY